jgi:hypothetical protein
MSSAKITSYNRVSGQERLPVSPSSTQYRRQATQEWLPGCRLLIHNSYEHHSTPLSESGQIRLDPMGRERLDTTEVRQMSSPPCAIITVINTATEIKFRTDCRQLLPNHVTSELPVILPQWATANRERQGALTESRTTIAGGPFYREWLCGAGQGCRGRILERLYIDNCLPSTVELFRQLAFFILSCKPVSYCRFKRIDVYIL